MDVNKFFKLVREYCHKMSECTSCGIKGFCALNLPNVNDEDIAEALETIGVAAQEKEQQL